MFHSLQRIDSLRQSRDKPAGRGIRKNPRRMSRYLVRALVLIVLLALPAAASAAPKGSAKAPKAPAASPGPEQATVKIVPILHLHGGKAQIFGTVPVVGSVAPFAPGQKVDVTFYLDGHKL